MLSFRPGFGIAFSVNTGWDGGLVRVEMPETLGARKGIFFYVPTLGNPPIHWVPGPDANSWRHHTETPGLVVEGTIALGDDVATMTLAVTNLGKETLEGVGAQVCVQLAAAPRFRDLERGRTYIFENGKPVSLLDIEKRDGFRGLTYLAKGCAPVPPHVPGGPPAKGQEWARCSAVQPDDAIILVASPQGDYTLGTTWEGATYVFNNPMGCLSCIHADPRFGDIAPGQTVTRGGWIVIANGPPDEAHARLLRLREGR